MTLVASLVPPRITPLLSPQRVTAMNPHPFTRFARLAIPVAVLSLCPLVQASQTFWVQTGEESPYDQILYGTTVRNHGNGINWPGYNGQTVIIPTDQSVFTGMPGNTRGSVTVPSSGPFADNIGLVTFCIDWMTDLRVSDNTNEIYDYRSYNYLAAESRYASEPVASYLPGGLLRAAYLLEEFFDEVNDDISGAALQAAIWEVLYDTSLNLDHGEGNFYIRTNEDVDGTEIAVANQGNEWLTLASAANWGGASYNPGTRVIFWLDPEDTDNNQSLISLNPANFTIEIPEPSTSILLISSIALGALRRRR